LKEVSCIQRKIRTVNYGFTKEIDALFEETLDKVSNEFERS
jgi:hypothetical protein